MRTALLQYPTDSRGFVRQCAWCHRVADERGAFDLAASSLLLGRKITHGCCDACLEGLTEEVKQLRQRRAPSAAVA